MAFELPNSSTVVGTIHITSYLNDDGEFKTGYDVDGMSDEAAIGYLTTVGDRLREEVKYRWDTCPGCGEDWDSHDDPEIYDQEDDDEIHD